MVDGKKMESEMENETRWRRGKERRRQKGIWCVCVWGVGWGGWKKITTNVADMGEKGSQEWMEMESNQGRRGVDGTKSTRERWWGGGRGRYERGKKGHTKGSWDSRGQGVSGVGHLL